MIDELARGGDDERDDGIAERRLVVGRRRPRTRSCVRARRRRCGARSRPCRRSSGRAWRASTRPRGRRRRAWSWQPEAGDADQHRLDRPRLHAGLVDAGLLAGVEVLEDRHRLRQYTGYCLIVSTRAAQPTESPGARRGRAGGPRRGRRGRGGPATSMSDSAIRATYSAPPARGRRLRTSRPASRSRSRSGRK